MLLKGPKAFLWAAVIIIVAILGAFVFIFFKGTGVAEDPALERAYFFSGASFDLRELKRFTAEGVEPAPLGLSGRVVDYARSGATEVALVVTDDNGADIFMREGEEWKRLTSDGGIKTRLELSPDGTLIAFSRRLESVPSSDPALYDLTVWNSYFFNPETGESSTFLNAFAPQFFTRDGISYLFYVDPDGIALVKLATEEGQHAFFTQAYDGRFPPQISDDGRFVGVYSVARETYDVFPLESTFPLIVGGTIGSLPPQTSVLEFRGERLYAGHESSGGLFTISSFALDLSGEGVALRELSEPPLYKIIFEL